MLAHRVGPAWLSGQDPCFVASFPEGELGYAKYYRQGNTKSNHLYEKLLLSSIDNIHMYNYYLDLCLKAAASWLCVYPPTFVNPIWVWQWTSNCSCSYLVSYGHTLGSAGHVRLAHTGETTELRHRLHCNNQIIKWQEKINISEQFWILLQQVPVVASTNTVPPPNDYGPI